MPYFSYHATAKKLIREGKLRSYFFTERYRSVSPALVLLFDDLKHPVMPIREHHWEEYMRIISELSSRKRPLI